MHVKNTNTPAALCSKAGEHSLLAGAHSGPGNCCELVCTSFIMCPSVPPQLMWWLSQVGLAGHLLGFYAHHLWAVPALVFIYELFCWGKYVHLCWQLCASVLFELDTSLHLWATICNFHWFVMFFSTIRTLYFFFLKLIYLFNNVIVVIQRCSSLHFWAFISYSKEMISYYSVRFPF